MNPNELSTADLIRRLDDLGAQQDRLRDERHEANNRLFAQLLALDRESTLHAERIRQLTESMLSMGREVGALRRQIYYVSGAIGVLAWFGPKILSAVGQ